MRQSATHVSSHSATHVVALDSKPPVAHGGRWSCALWEEDPGEAGEGADQD